MNPMFCSIFFRYFFACFFCAVSLGPVSPSLCPGFSLEFARAMFLCSVWPGPLVVQQEIRRVSIASSLRP